MGVSRVPTLLSRKKYQGFREEGRSLYTWKGCHPGGGGRLCQVGSGPTWKPEKEIWIYFWALFYPIGSHVCPMPRPHCLDFCGPAVSLKTGKCESSNYVLLFQACFSFSGLLIGILGSAHQFLQTKNKTKLGFLEIALNLQIT